MEKAATVAEKVLMASAGVALLLGLIVWINEAYSLVGLHELVGYTLIASLWTLVGIAARSGVRTPMVAGALAWSVLVLALGWGQEYLFTGSLHWVVRVLHLVISMASVAWGRALAAKIRQGQRVLMPAER